MSHRHPWIVPLFAGLALTAVLAPPASAGLLDSGPVYTPRVPISALARPLGWLDPSKLHFSSVTTVGSGGRGSNGFDALQVTSLHYSFAAPLAMSVSLGNAWGPAATDGRSSFFLEGLDLQYRPSPSLQFQIQYRDVRSPLQLQRGPGPWGW
jgi:hypothetical protein